MSDEKKKNDGHYVVLQFVDGGVELGLALTEVGRFQAHRAEEALKQACAGGLTGKFLVMPLRSYRTFEVEQATVVQVKAVE